MIVNVLLCKYENAWVEVGGGDVPDADRREAMIEMGGVLNLAEAVAIAESLLAIWSLPRRAVVVSGLPMFYGGSTALSFAEGDTLTLAAGVGSPAIAAAEPTAQRVKSITVSEDDDGKVTIAPELAATLDVEEARVNRILARYASGAAGGAGSGPVPAANVNARPTRIVELPPFSLSGAMTPAGLLSPPYVPARPMLLTGVTVALSVAGSTATTFSLMIDDVAATTVTIGSGLRLYHQVLAVVISDPTSSVEYRLDTATDASGLVIHTQASLI